MMLINCLQPSAANNAKNPRLGDLSFTERHKTKIYDLCLQSRLFFLVRKKSEQKLMTK